MHMPHAQLRRRIRPRASTVECVRTLRVACVRPRMYIDQNLQLGTVTESKTTPSRTIPWGSVKVCAPNSAVTDAGFLKGVCVTV